MPRPGTFEIEPVRATRTFEAAIEHLTEAIERAGLRTGERLPNEGALAEQLGISKPTLRQALRVLELSGLVDVRRGKSGGIFVVTDLVPSVAIFTAVKLEEEAAVDVLRARRVLERAVAHEAMRAASPGDLVELERTVDLLERHLGERPSVMRADAMFHRALVRSCRNETIQAAMRGVGRGLAPIRDAYSGGGAAGPQDPQVHRRQIAAMRRHDESAPEEAPYEHFRMLKTQFAKGIGRRWSDDSPCAHAARSRPPAADAQAETGVDQPETSVVTARGSASNTASSTSPRSSLSTWNARGRSQRTRRSGRRRGGP